MKTGKRCKCGTENPDDAKYCRKCGIIIGYQTTTNNNGKKSKAGYWWFAVMIMAAIVGIIIAINNDNSIDYSYEEPDIMEEPVDDVSIRKEPSITYLTVSNDDIHFNADGGAVDIDISTDGDWEISVQPESWGHITRHGSYLTLSIDRNSNNSNRTDYFKVKAGSYEKKVDITQYANTEPSAAIDSVWVEYNEIVNGNMGMKIHAKFTTENMKDKTVYVYVNFYYADNSTALHDAYSNQLFLQTAVTPSYDSSIFSDLALFMPYISLNMPPGWNGVLTFNVVIRNASGEFLCAVLKNQFVFKN